MLLIPPEMFASAYWTRSTYHLIVVPVRDIVYLRAEQKYVGGGSAGSLIEDRDFSLSWEEYDRKYLNK